MQANDDNENEDDALEGLAGLNAENPYQGAPIHREEQFINSNLVNSGTFDAYRALEMECFVSKKVNGIYQNMEGGTQCRVVCRSSKGRFKWDKVLKKY
ncbi:unnamed protein product [Bathycoccus prasinos]